MKSMREVFRLMTMTAALAVVALPTMAAKPPQAQDKSYGIEFLVPPTANGKENPFYVDGAVPGDKFVQVPVTVTVYIKNESPPSTAASNFSSASFDLSPSLVVVGQPGCVNATCAVNGNTVFVSGISPPVQGQQILAVTLQVNTCVVAGEAFISNVKVYTGSQFSGSEFSLSNTDETFRPALTLSTRVPFDFTQKVTPAVTGISCGNIACAQPFTIGNLDPSGLDYRVVTGWRGRNSDGTCSDTSHLSFSATNKLGVITDPTPETNRSLHFVWPVDSTSRPVFAYKATRSGAGTAWEVGWMPKPGVPVSIPAPVCNGGLLANEPTTFDALPLPHAYGVLTQDAKANAKTIKVDTGTNAPPLVPSGGLPIVIQSERMLVTDIGSGGWSVTRTNPVFHAASTTVASTPMPLLGSVPPPYASGTAAQICMAWTNGTSAWFIDGSDGWVLGR